MEEAVMDALLAAGERLSEAMSAGLIERGFAGKVTLRVEEGRVAVATRSPAVVEAELGSAARAPSAPLEAAARSASAEIVGLLSARIREAM